MFLDHSSSPFEKQTDHTIRRNGSLRRKAFPGKSATQRSLHFAFPDFLSTSVALMICMRFSFTEKGTHETSQEIGGVGHPVFGAGIERKGALLPD
jgi:hypothetical protein